MALGVDTLLHENERLRGLHQRVVVALDAANVRAGLLQDALRTYAPREVYELTLRRLDIAEAQFKARVAA